MGCVAGILELTSIPELHDPSCAPTNSIPFSTDMSLEGAVLITYHKHKAAPPQPTNVLRNHAVPQRLLNYSDTHHQEQGWGEEAEALPSPFAHFCSSFGLLELLNIFAINHRGKHQTIPASPLPGCNGFLIFMGEPHEGDLLTCVCGPLAHPK